MQRVKEIFSRPRRKVVMRAGGSAPSRGGSTRTLRRDAAHPGVYVIGKINYTHRGGGGATASEIPPQSAAYLKSSRRRKLDSSSPLSLTHPHPPCRSPTPTSGVGVGVCVCVCMCAHTCTYISTSRADAAKPRAGVATAPKSSTDSLMVISHLCNLRHPSSRAFSISDYLPLPAATHLQPSFSRLPPAPFEPSLVRESRHSWGMCTSRRWEDKRPFVPRGGF